MSKTAIILGATGLTGDILINLLLVDARYTKIRVFGRTPVGIRDSKIEEHLVDMLNLGEQTLDFRGDVVFCCIGTTNSKTPDKELYRKIDYGIPLAAAKLCNQNAIETMIVISAMGANFESSVFYNKTKGRINVHKEYGDLPKVECLPSKINQVFMNLLTNSIQAIEGKGDIFIETISSGIGVKIIIRDTGAGMSTEVKKHIFEPFYTTKEVGSGTGLGLAISYGIIEQHQGNIDVISEDGKGTEFIISLPIVQPDSN